MNLPLVIKFTQANLNSIDDNPQRVIKELSGKHICYFYYSEPLKNHTKVRICVDNLDYNMIVTIGKDHLNFYNPWFRNYRSLAPVNEEDAIIQECEIILDDTRRSAVDILIDKNMASSLAEVRDLITQCANLKKPISPVKKEKEKDIWTAYCDGLNALSQERRNFIDIDYVGTPILYNDTKLGGIYTMKLGIASTSIEKVPEKVNELLSERYRISSVALNEDATQLDITCKGTEKILEDDLDTLNDYLRDFGFTMPNNGIINVLKTSISCLDIESRTDLFDKLDEQLTANGIVFINNSKLEYRFWKDDDANQFILIANNIFKGIAHPQKIKNIKTEVDLDADTKESIKNDLYNEKNIVVTKKHIIINFSDKEEYDCLKEKAYDVCKSYGIELTFPKYQIVYKIVENDGGKYRRSLLQKAAEALDEFRRISYHYEFDIEQARVIRFEYRFRNAEERENFIAQFTATVKTLGPYYKLTLKERLGTTIIKYKRDALLSQQIEEDLRLNYQGEEIKLVAGKVYRDLFKNVQDPENIIDYELREQYNRFMNECPIIGTCYQRTENSIIVKLSEDFYDGQQMDQAIRKGDMVFFPSVGSSTELRRQFDAIQRINKPGETVAGRKIEPPVNPQLCNFLFDPLYAHDIHADINETMSNIQANKLEEHLNEKQIEAVAKAILAKDIAFIQGPPGTGKTTVIAEIIWQEIRRNPKCKILLTSQTNLAVDNALERLRNKRAIRPLRVVSDQRNDSDDLNYNIMLLDSWVEEPNEYNKNNVVEKWIDSIISRIDKYPSLSSKTDEWRNTLVKRDKAIRKEFVDRYKSNVNLIAATCSICGSRIFRQMFEKIYESTDVAFDVVIMDEASKATPLEMAVPMVLGKKIIVIGDHKQLPPVLDENSIDTALRKIGREDIACKIQDFKESQFKKLFLLCQKFKPNLVTTLDTQYRMHKDIMMTVNQFYVDELGENGLKCGIEDVMNVPDYTVKGSRWHGISYEPFISPDTHAVWVNVDGIEEKVNTSFKNEAEIKAVQTVVKALSKATGFYDYIHGQKKIEDKEIGLITFYSAQKRELKNLEQNGLLDNFLDYRIDVVDRFQGMERNIVIVSTVRSNRHNGIGFAKEIERINVAFSRARTLLIVIGNRDLFYTKYNYKKSIDKMEYIDIKQIEDLLHNEY